MRFRIQWAIWCCRIPLECTILTNLLQAFARTSSSELKVRKDSISLRSITSFLHTCLHTSNPLGFFTIIILIRGLLVYHCKKRYLLTNSLLIASPPIPEKWHKWHFSGIKLHYYMQKAYFKTQDYTMPYRKTKFDGWINKLGTTF